MSQTRFGLLSLIKPVASKKQLLHLRNAYGASQESKLARLFQDVANATGDSHYPIFTRPKPADCTSSGRKVISKLALEQIYESSRTECGDK
ncbi:hypothetical protein BDM02DRAFT_3270237 [Thelephora ganbajun]|uniref:Uncharacterized protein n=1 Tax=Thelephora ganbajun TaxID=370292 RepID=A0ACB6ZDG1_THEGA|nr:hypothetical protein BDM02DRAFT_3270237 [Thelephora ganbajun]